MVWTRFRKIAAVAVGTGAGIAFSQYFHQPQKNKVSASWTNSEQPLNPCAVWDSNWDYRDFKSLVRPVKDNSTQEQNRYNNEIEKLRPKSTRHIILVRHGEYLDVGNSDHDHHLTERGRIQAKHTGQRLHELGIKWDKVVVSTMTRAKETADIIFKQIDVDPCKITQCSYIREGAPIPPQPPVGHWRPEQSQFFRDGARIEAGFRRYFHRAFPEDKQDTYTLIVGHANVIRYFVCRALQFPPEGWLRININHASITWLSIAPSGNVSIKYLGDTGYMPAHHLTHRIPRESKSVV